MSTDRVLITAQSLADLLTAAEQSLNITRGSDKWKPFYDETEQAVIEGYKVLGIPRLSSLPLPVRLPVNGKVSHVNRS